MGGEILNWLGAGCGVLTVGFATWHLYGRWTMKNKKDPKGSKKMVKLKEFREKPTEPDMKVPVLTVGDGVTGLTVGDGVIGLTVGDGVTGLTVGDGVTGLTVGDGVIGLTVGDGVTGLTVGDGVTGLTVGDGVSGLTVGDELVVEYGVEPVVLELLREDTRSTEASPDTYILSRVEPNPGHIGAYAAGAWSPMKAAHDGGGPGTYEIRAMMAGEEQGRSYVVVHPDGRVEPKS
jgi:hypothetical protein